MGRPHRRLHSKAWMFADVHPGNILSSAAAGETPSSPPPGAAPDQREPAGRPASADLSVPGLFGWGAGAAGSPAGGCAARAGAAPSPTVSLVDLGSAQRLAAVAGQARPSYAGPARGGSWGHMALEQFPDPAKWPLVVMDASADVYAATAVLLHCLTGREPFVAPGPPTKPSVRASRAAPLRHPRAAFDVLAPALEQALRAASPALQGVATPATPETQAQVARVATVLASTLEARPEARPGDAAALIAALQGTVRFELL
ncbi:hypothetical protein FNF28_03550 [Cafeteria roenbergensis]|uniref:Protein kinase domain-containing protein n=2 Tax=Cafeteria roenbergensis TaxID=33653 RepID=A0A5A8DMS2_CAFRO|nr:hypothetical protein FNF28_03550 [Cafeteria roenbergensis]